LKRWVNMRSSLVFIKLNEKLKGARLEPTEREIVISASDPYCLTVFKDEAEKTYQSLLKRFGEFVKDSVYIELDGKEEIENLIKDAIASNLRKREYILHEPSEILKFLKGENMEEKTEPNERIEELKELKAELMREINRLEQEGKEGNLNHKLGVYLEAEGLKTAVGRIERRILELGGKIEC